MVMHACNPRASEVDGGSSEVQGHPGLRRDFETSLGRLSGVEVEAEKKKKSGAVENLDLPRFLAFLIKPPLS